MSISHSKTCKWWHRLPCSCGAAAAGPALSDDDLLTAIRRWHTSTPMGDQVAALVLLATIEDALLKRKSESAAAQPAEDAVEACH